MSDVFLDAFRDLVKTAQEDGLDSITVAANSFANSVTETEFVEAVKYAAQANIEVIFVPDTIRREPDYNSQDEDMKRINLESLNELLLNPIR